MPSTNPDDSLRLKLRSCPQGLKALEKVAANFAKDLSSSQPRGEVMAKAAKLNLKLAS